MNINMAEGETQEIPCRESFSNASGDADESFCDSCINRGEYIVVKGFCQTCQEYMCEHCLEVHKNQKISRNHTILDKMQMPTRKTSDTVQSICTEVCKHHYPETVRFYCKSHDEPGCVDCMALSHANCKKDRVQDISDGFQATKEFKQMQQSLDKFHKELETIEYTLEDDMKSLNTAFNDIQQKITSFRIQMNDNLDKMQKQITEEAEKLKKEREAEMNRMIAENESMKSELKDVIQRIQNDPNVNTLFVLTKQANKRMVRLEKELKKVKQSQREQAHYTFRPSSEIESLVSAKTPFGKLARKPNINTTASYRGYINAKSNVDERECCISDVTLLDAERIVAVDTKNYKVKLIDISKNTVISSYRTMSQAWRVTALSTNQVALTVPNESKIKLLNVTSTISKHHDIHINGSCYGLAYHDGKLAVSYIDPGRIEIMDKDGNVIHRIQPKQGTVNVLQKPLFIAFGRNSETVIVSDFRTNTVSVVTFDGQIIHKHRHASLKGSSGIVITADGVLFHCSWDNGRINVLAQDLKTGNAIIHQDDNTRNPESIAYCDTKHRLYITNDLVGGGPMNNVIQVYDLNV